MADVVVQPCILDRDTGSRGEGEHDALVLVVEVATAALLGQIEVPEDLITHPYWHAKEAHHRWMIRREAEGCRMFLEIVQPQRARVVDQEAEDAAAARQGSDTFDGLVIDADGDELREPVSYTH